MHLIYDGVTLTKAPKNSDLRQKHFQDSLQAKGVTAFDFVFHCRPRGAAFLLGEAGERHAEKVGEVQAEQVWTLWQIDGASRYSSIQLLPWIVKTKTKQVACGN